MGNKINPFYIFSPQKLKSTRIKSGLSQEKLANISGINKSTISAYEQDKIKNPSIPHVKRIAEALKVPERTLYNHVESVLYDSISSIEGWDRYSTYNLAKAFVEGNDITSISKKFERKPSVIKRKLYNLGLIDNPNPNPSTRPINIWTDAEIAFLAENYLFMDLDELSVKLNRTKRAIQYRASKMGITKSAYKNSGLITINQLVEAFGISETTAYRWVNKYGLPTIRTTRGIYLINPKQFWKWARLNNRIIPWKRYKSRIIPSPQGQWRMYTLINSNSDYRRKEWSMREIVGVIQQYKDGESIKNIAMDYGVNKSAIQYILHKYGKKVSDYGI